MRFCAGLFTIMLLISSCGEKKEEEVVLMEQPADLIEQDKMIQILADVHLLEAALQYRSPRVPSITPYSINGVDQPAVAALPTEQKTLPYYDIFVKRGVTRAQYENSLRWYMTDAPLYGQMYDEVINELVRRQTQEQKKVGMPAQPADSVK